MKLKGINVVFVFVANIQKSKEFYQKTLGLAKPVKDTPEWIEWKVGRGSNFAIHKAPERVLEGTVPSRSAIKFSFEVDNIRSAYNELFEAGIRVLAEPQDDGSHTYVEFLDLDGNVIQILQYN